MAWLADLIARDLPDDPPQGYKLLPTGVGFNQLLGSVYGRLKDGRLTLGMRISPRHLNPQQTCHGGVLASFADMQGYIAQHEGGATNNVTPTINMSIDYLAPALLGDWLEGHTSLLKATRNLLFLQTVTKVDEKPIFRSSGIFKVGPISNFKGATLNNFFVTMEEK
jgi:uncharacterized protein (TIGR00369 family)